MTERNRAIVIGAGHNGLVCAAYLAKAGRETIVVEAAERRLVGAPLDFPPTGAAGRKGPGVDEPEDIPHG